MHAMAWWQALVLGIVEGLTEYLPVSSTGHLLVVQDLMGIPGEHPTTQAKEAAKAFAIIIQSGAILAVAGLYFARVKQMVRGLLGRDIAGRRLAVNLVVAFLPAAVAGLALNKWIEKHLESPWPIIAAWLVGGLAILLVTWQRRGFRRRRSAGGPPLGLGIDDINWQMALLVGMLQILGMWPGTSRSLITIVGGLLAGLSMAAAVEFSFLLGLITLTAATVYKARHGGSEMIHEYGWAMVAVGFIAATISAALAVEWMVNYLKRHSLAIFGWYRVALAIAVAILVWRGLVT